VVIEGEEGGGSRIVSLDLMRILTKKANEYCRKSVLAVCRHTVRSETSFHYICLGVGMNQTSGLGFELHANIDVPLRYQVIPAARRPKKCYMPCDLFLVEMRVHLHP
jgi:hypothetical protein